MMSGFVVAVGSSFGLSVVVKATMLLAIGLLAARVLVRARAAVRHVVLASTFASILLLPIVMFVVPAVVLDVPVAAAAPAGGPQERPAAAAPVEREERGVVRTILVAIARTNHAVQNGRIWPDWAGALWVIWAAGAAAGAGVLAVGLRRAAALRRSALPCIPLQGLAARLARDASLSRQPDVVSHERASTPLTCGFRRAAIVMPADVEGWRGDDVTRALIHEIEHVRRGDWLVQNAARIVCAVYWFHPLAWVAWRQLCLEAERACDDAVVRTSERTDYAEQLVSLARRCSNLASPLPLAMARRSDLTARVSALLDGRRERGRAGGAAVAAACVMAALLTASLAPVQAIAAPQPARARSGNPGSDRALLRAAERGNLEQIEQLIAGGANPNAVFGGDGTPLIVAAREGHVDAVGLLLDRGADPNIGVEGDGNPLIMAAREGHDDIVGLLLTRGAAVDRIVPGDENALIQASGNGHLAIVTLLVARGASVHTRVWTDSWDPAKAGEWRTPLSMARRGGHAEVAAFLEGAGAR